MTMLEEDCVVVEGELEESLELFELVERLELLFLKVFFFEVLVVGSFLKLILRSGTQAERKRSLAYNEDEQYKSVVFNRAFPS